MHIILGGIMKYHAENSDELREALKEKFDTELCIKLKYDGFKKSDQKILLETEEIDKFALAKLADDCKISYGGKLYAFSTMRSAHFTSYSRRDTDYTSTWIELTFEEE